MGSTPIAGTIITDGRNNLNFRRKYEMQTLSTIMPLILLIAVMYFLLIRPQKKREKEVNAMRSGVQVGDEIITIGGICGKIVKTKDESLVIQVGADKVKFEIMRWAVSKVVEEGKRSKAASEEEAPKKMPKRIKKAAVEEVVAEETPVVEETVVEEAVEETTEEK
jgi:preprotein translocase subunit YajC